MKLSELKCRKCGKNAMQVNPNGIYLERVNPKGEPHMIAQCFPACEHKCGNADDALFHAIEGT